MFGFLISWEQLFSRRAHQGRAGTGERRRARASQDAVLLTAPSPESATGHDVLSGHRQESLPITPTWGQKTQPPTPNAARALCSQLHNHENPVTLHGYTPADAAAGQLASRACP